MTDPFKKELRENVFDDQQNAGENGDKGIEETFRAVREEYPRLCRFVMDYARQYTANREKCSDIEVSLGEIFSNIQFYSSEDPNVVPEITVTLTQENGMLKIVFADNGVPFNPLDKAEPSLEENRRNQIVGGFGIFLVRKLMDNVTYEYNGKNTLALMKNLKEESE